MPVPEAALDLYDQSTPADDNVGTTWKGLDVQPKTQSKRIEGPTDLKLRTGIR